MSVQEQTDKTIHMKLPRFPTPVLAGSGSTGIISAYLGTPTKYNNETRAIIEGLMLEY